MSVQIAVGVSGNLLRQLIALFAADYFYGERETDVVLTRAMPVDTPFDWWQHGRLFDDQTELAFWKEANDYTLRLVGTPPSVAGIGWQQLQLDIEQTDMLTLLHGTLDESTASDGQPTWSEARIPRPLPYPVDDVQARVALESEQFAEHAHTRFTRLAGVTGASE